LPDCLFFQLGEDGDVGDGVIGETESEEVKCAKLLEVEAVRAAEGGSLGDVLELLNQAITVAPNYASPYNNRAQVRGREEERERERERVVGGGGETLVPSPSASVFSEVAFNSFE
jgi:hypothetical protein